MVVWGYFVSDVGSSSGGSSVGGNMSPHTNVAVIVVVLVLVFLVVVSLEVVVIVVVVVVGSKSVKRQDGEKETDRDLYKSKR